MSEDGIRWIAERDVRELVSLPEAVEALDGALLSLAGGTAANVPKAVHAWEGGSLHSLGSVDLGQGLGGFKSWVNTPEGAAAIFVLFDAVSGRTLAVVEAVTLGMLRTAAVSAIATRELTPPDVATLALVGTGRQAMLQLAAVASVRALEHVRVWSPNPRSREAFAERARERLGLPIEPQDSLAAALAGAPVVTTVTRAKEPFLSAAHLSPGAHLNAVGSVLPSFAELLPDVMASADLIVVDDEASARTNSRELRDFLADRTEGDEGERRVLTLDRLVFDPPGGSEDRRLSVFKSMGMGVSDLAVAAEVYRRAVSDGAGEVLPPPEVSLPRLGRGRG